MISLSTIRNITSRIKFRDFTFRSDLMGNDGYFVQVVFTAPCTVTGDVSEQHGRKYYLSEQHGRKYYLSRHALEDEVIKTCWVAVELALRHEAMEDFLVDGVAIFHPHTDCARLIELQSTDGVHVHREKQT